MIPLPPGPNFHIDGRRALVTGGSSGIGLAAAVVLARRSPLQPAEPLAEACASLQAGGLACDALVLDVTDSRAVNAALDNQIDSAQKPFGILVNSAGMNRPKPLVDLDDADIDALLELNVKAAFFVARAFARQLTESRGSGSIINISSQMGHVDARRTLYCASKHALERMTKALAFELGKAAYAWILFALLLSKPR